MRLRLKKQRQSPVAGVNDHAAPRSACSIFLLVLVLLGFVSSNLFAQPKPSNPPPISNRFLFIIDTSSAMKNLQRDEMKVVYELLVNSATGQMHSGDSVGLWTFNQDVHSDLSVQTWTAENQNQIIQRTMSFLQQQRYAKASRLDKALSDMQDVIQESDIITVFIVSSGHGKMTGTPFDKDINALYKHSLADMKHDPRPVITVLQAKGGKLVHFTVNTMPWPVVVPELPIPIRAAQPLPMQANTTTPLQNTSSATNALIIRPTRSSAVPPLTTPQTAVQPPPLPQHPASAPLPATAASASTSLLPFTSPPPMLRAQTPFVASAPPSQSPPQNASQPAPSAAKPQTTPTPPTTAPSDVVASSAPPATRTPPLLPVVKQQPAPLSTSPIANNNERPMPSPLSQPNSPTNSASSNPADLAVAPDGSLSSNQTLAPTNAAPAVHSKPDAQSTTAASATNSLSSRAYAFVSPEVNGRPKSLLIAGLALVLLALVLIVVMVRRSRATTGPSLISQTMGNGSKK